MDEHQEDLEKVDRINVENARLQSLLDMEPNSGMNRDLQSHGAKEEVSPGEQEARSSLSQENPEPTLVKEEEEALWTTEEEEQLPGLDSDIKAFRLTSPCVTTGFDQVIPQTELGRHLMQTLENREMTTWASQLTKAEPQIKTEPEVDGYEEPTSTSDSVILSVVIPDHTQITSQPRNPERETAKRQSFPEPSTLQTGESSRSHDDSPTGDGQHQCNDCGKCFDRSVLLDRHMMIHTVVKSFKCKDCGKRFKCKSYLNRHMLTLHTGDKSFKCETCGVCFHWKSEFNRHMMIHSGEKANKCEECGKGFILKSDLNRHIVIHTKEKTFKCKECSKSFNWRSDLTAHMISHTGGKKFNCEKCGKSFDTKGHLNRHMILHTGGETFNCKECGKGFNREANLNRHMMLHTKDDPFRCKECGKCLRVNREMGNEKIVVRLICEHLLNKEVPG